VTEVTDTVKLTIGCLKPKYELMFLRTMSHELINISQPLIAMSKIVIKSLRQGTQNKKLETYSAIKHRDEQNL
jgi:hypothetical protein